MLLGESMEEKRKKLRTLAEMQRVVSEMEAKGYELDRIEGTDKEGFYMVFKRVGL